MFLVAEFRTNRTFSVVDLNTVDKFIMLDTISLVDWGFHANVHFQPRLESAVERAIALG
jgi:hypothetical protein